MSEEKKASTAESFQAIDPWKSETLSFQRRHLPHLQAAGATYFVTFRSIVNLTPMARGLVIAEIQYCSRNLIFVDAAVVMPDHVHLLFRLMGDEKLSDVLRVIKGRSSKRINEALARSGNVWMEESFDHIIRNEAELEDKVKYIQQNPVKKGLVKEPAEYEWLIEGSK